jgi:hypothetical protein
MSRFIKPAGNLLAPKETKFGVAAPRHARDGAGSNRSACEEITTACR